MIKTYKANPKYPLSILFCLFLFSIPTLFAVIDWIKYDNEATLIILFTLLSLVVAAYIFTLAREVTISETNVEVKTLFLKRTIPIQQIKSISKNYSTKSMFWYANDKSKAHMLCSVRYGKNPLAFFLIHNGISEYKKACEQIEKMKV